MAAARSIGGRLPAARWKRLRGRGRRDDGLQDAQPHQPVDRGAHLAALRAAAVEREAASLLGAGRLAGEIGSSGFAAVAELAPPATRRSKSRPKDDGAARRREQELRKVRARVERLERRAADEEERADRAEQAARDARGRAEQAKTEAAAARAELDDLA